MFVIPNIRLAAGGDERIIAPSTKGDHGGHLIGTQFNGSPLIDNNEW